MKKQTHIFILVIISLFSVFSCGQSVDEPDSSKEALNVLIFSKTGGYRHECIEPGGAALQAFFKANGISTLQTEDSTELNAGNLSKYDVVMFFQTTGNILDSIQQDAVADYVRSGKGFVGVHSVADTEYDWPWFASLVGAQLLNHPEIQQATLVKMDTSHPATQFLPDRWTRTDEWYNFKQLPSNVRVLLTIDESTYDGGANGDFHPMAWCQTYDGGRTFYTALGHTVESYSDTLFLRHIMEGVKWASGK